ncbi:MAG TPA: potassium channel family protein [Pyrinomonadaceae bacterium]|jgi:voltage-gated potassium channel Kch|nr:potassium channel family protein [Pyrinomonadaceae bacterium]
MNPKDLFVIAASLALIFVVVWDAFETIVLPRRVTRRVRITAAYYRATWRPWRDLALSVRNKKRRETFLSIYGPLSLVFLIALWAAGLVFAFGMLHWAAGTSLNVPSVSQGFSTDLYMSGTTFFTLGYGDVTPLDAAGRFLAVVEAGMGFGVLAIVIGYLPVLYQAFSRRESNISLLDARAGTPPTAAELLRRHGRGGGIHELVKLLEEWERWAADLMESHLSYPVLCFFRSQHDNQSWLASLTTILDGCALVMVGIDGASTWQAQLTFAMARHAVVDLSQIFNLTPAPWSGERLRPEALARLRAVLAADGVSLRDGAEAEEKLASLRRMYEPYVASLAAHLSMPLPAWVDARAAVDNWQTSAFERNPQQVAETFTSVCDQRRAAGAPPTAECPD